MGNVLVRMSKTLVATVENGPSQVARGSFNIKPLVDHAFKNVFSSADHDGFTYGHVAESRSRLADLVLRERVLDIRFGVVVHEIHKLHNAA